MRLPRLVRLLVAAAVALGSATGCTAPVAGRPTAAPPPPPTRPREVRLDGVDPCSLLTAEQRAALGFTSEPRPAKAYVDLFRAEVPSCTMLGFKPAVGLGVTTVTSVGIERWRQGDLAASIRPTSVGGFPALVATPTKYTTYCSVEVDVAPGQLLDVQVLDAGGRPPIAQAELCQRGERIAEVMMTTLLSR